MDPALEQMAQALVDCSDYRAIRRLQPLSRIPPKLVETTGLMQ
jgi:hypothetical protein